MEEPNIVDAWFPLGSDTILASAGRARPVRTSAKALTATRLLIHALVHPAELDVW